MDHTESTGERIARLEERLASMADKMDAIHEAQTANTMLIAKTIGGAKVIAVLGGLSGIGSAMHTLAGWLGVHLTTGGAGQ